MTAYIIYIYGKIIRHLGNQLFLDMQEEPYLACAFNMLVDNWWGLLRDMLMSMHFLFDL